MHGSNKEHKEECSEDHRRSYSLQLSESERVTAERDHGCASLQGVERKIEGFCMRVLSKGRGDKATHILCLRTGTLTALREMCCVAAGPDSVCFQLVLKVMKKWDLVAGL